MTKKKRVVKGWMLDSFAGGVAQEFATERFWIYPTLEDAKRAGWQKPIKCTITYTLTPKRKGKA